MSQTLLIVEDDPKTAAALRLYLEAAGFAVEVAGDGPTGLARARSGDFALVLLDLMLPELDGRAVCAALRRESDLPILMLTARSTEDDRVQGLELGADDYIVKPFSPREVVARVRAVLRRSGEEPRRRELRHGGLRLDRERRSVRVEDHSLDLTPTEYRLVETLLAAPGRVFSRQELIERALGEDFEGSDRTVDAHVRNLRRKLVAAGAEAGLVATVHGAGYRLWRGGDD